jgi:glycerophosphoryl diester phosphodiesterase
MVSTAPTILRLRSYARPMPHPSGRPWIIAHRGASHDRPENTVDAFRHARTLGADAVELDVRRTADGTLVVIHDPVIGGRPVVETTRSRLAAVAPSVPDLTDALAACSGLWVDVEVKNDPSEPDWEPEATLAGTVVRLLAGRDDIVISSFDPASVGIAVAAGMRAGLLVDEGVDPIAAMATVGGLEFLFPPLGSMDAAGEVVAAASASGVEVGVWWTDNPATMRRLAAAGVGAIFTKSPDVARGAFG